MRRRVRCRSRSSAAQRWIVSRTRCWGLFIPTPSARADRHMPQSCRALQVLDEAARRRIDSIIRVRIDLLRRCEREPRVVTGSRPTQGLCRSRPCRPWPQPVCCHPLPYRRRRCRPSCRPRPTTAQRQRVQALRVSRLASSCVLPSSLQVRRRVSAGQTRIDRCVIAVVSLLRRHCPLVSLLASAPGMLVVSVAGLVCDVFLW
jgi:hypothetical protein